MAYFSSNPLSPHRSYMRSRNAATALTTAIIRPGPSSVAALPSAPGNVRARLFARLWQTSGFGKSVLFTECAPTWNISWISCIAPWNIILSKISLLAPQEDASLAEAHLAAQSLALQTSSSTNDWAYRLGTETYWQRFAKSSWTYDGSDPSTFTLSANPTFVSQPGNSSQSRATEWHCCRMHAMEAGLRPHTFLNQQLQNSC